MCLRAGVKLHLPAHVSLTSEKNKGFWNTLHQVLQNPVHVLLTCCDHRYTGCMFQLHGVTK